MNKKITFTISGRKFDVDVGSDIEFASFLSYQMTKDLNVNGNNDLKALLQAYVKKNHDLFLQEKEIKRIVQKLSV